MTPERYLATIHSKGGANTTSNVVLSTLSCQRLYQIPQAARFIISGGIGNIAFFALDKTLYEQVLEPMCKRKRIPKFLSENLESTSFFLAYMIQIVLQHLLNAVLVYGWETIATREKYLATLILSYSSYFVAVTGSTICNAILLKSGVSRSISFWGTIGGFGIFNYFLLKHLIGEVDNSSNSHDDKKRRGGKQQRNSHSHHL